MHPHRGFAWDDRGAMLDFLRTVSFSTICAEGPAVAHAPIVVAGPDRLLFHLSRGNLFTRGLRDGTRAIVSCLGPDAYISPDWYGTDDQVPTWNYVAVEAEGPLHRLDETRLTELLDQLSSEHEARLVPKKPWTRGKMNPGRFDGMLKAIVGYELRIESLRGTRKLGQNKTEAERAQAAHGLAAHHPIMAEMMLPISAGGAKY